MESSEARWYGVCKGVWGLVWQDGVGLGFSVVGWNRVWGLVWHDGIGFGV